MTGAYQVGVTVVIVAVPAGADGAVPRLVTVASRLALPPGEVADAGERRPGDQLPGAPLEPSRWRTLQEGVRAVAEDISGLNLRYVEQLYTFGDRGRDPHELAGGPRSLVVSYLALVRDGPLGGSAPAAWQALYRYFPWEDWRAERPPVLDQLIRPRLARWCEGGAAAARAQRVQRAFAFDGGEWDPERVLDRYELLYEAGLVAEAGIDRALRRQAGLDSEPPPESLPQLPPEPESPPLPPGALGWPMARDGRRILATALERLRGKLKYRPLVFELLPPAFTLHQVQQVVEALSGTLLHKPNFRRLITQNGLIEPTGQLTAQAPGRPAQLFRFRRQAILERTSSAAIGAGDPWGEAG